MNKKLIVLSALFIWATSAFSQSSSSEGAAHKVSLSAQAQVQVVPDLLTFSLTTVREASAAQAVQAQLKSALDAALSSVRADTAPGLMDVRTGRFGLSPRYARDGNITGWQGSAELVLEGSDFVRLAGAAGKVQSLSVARVSFGLSPAQRERAQAQAQTQAIAMFRQRAADIAHAFGATGYVVDDVNVQFDDAFVQPRREMMTVRAMADAAPVPVEAGLMTVSVSASGSVRLQ